MMMYLNPLYLITGNNMSIDNSYSKKVYYYYLEGIYGQDLYMVLRESEWIMFHFEFDTRTVYLTAPDEFIARIALLDLGYGIVK
jgi:hypothetical protein